MTNEHYATDCCGLPCPNDTDDTTRYDETTEKQQMYFCCVSTNRGMSANDVDNLIFTNELRGKDQIKLNDIVQQLAMVIVRMSGNLVRIEVEGLNGRIDFITLSGRVVMKGETNE